MRKSDDLKKPAVQNWPPAETLAEIERSRQRQLARILSFTQRQEQTHAWVRLSVVADNCGPDGYRTLLKSILNGYFEPNGRSRVLYLHPWGGKPRMTRDRMKSLAEIYSATPWILNSQYVRWCWVPHEMAIVWCSVNEFQVGGWLDPSETAKSLRGRKIGSNVHDDSDYLIEMARAIGWQRLSKRQAAERAVNAIGWSKERGLSEPATVDRVRSKFRAGLMR